MNTNVKRRWQRTKTCDLEATHQRLRHIYANRPIGLPWLIRYGVTSDGLVFTEEEYLRGSSLKKIYAALNQNERQWVIKKLGHLLQRWALCGFVHGDLHPGNIIVQVQPQPELYCIDWLVNLNSFKATPGFAAQEVWHGTHTHAGDLHSLEMITRFLLKQ